MTARARRWIGWTAVGLVAVVVSGVLVVAAAPWAVRWAASAWAESITGRPVTAGEVRVSLRDARVVFLDVAVASAAGEPPLAAVERIVVDLRWRPMLRGRVRIERLEIGAPIVRIVRTADGATSVDDVVARLQRAPTTGAPLDIEIERAALDDGRVVFTDRQGTPAQTWEFGDIAAAFADLATRGTPRGTGSITGRLAGGDMRIDADQLRLWPFHARAEARATALDIAGIAAYIPADARLRPVAGRLSSHAQATIDEHGVRLQGRATLDELRLLRPGQREAFVTSPRITLSVDGVRIARAEPTTAERVELEASARIHDTRAAGGTPVVLPRVHGVVRNISVGDGGAPAAVSLDVALPDNGALEARGTVTFDPLATDLVVRVSDAPVGPLAAYIPAASPVQVATGRLGAELRVAYAAADGVRLSGELETSRLELRRRDTADPFLVHPRLDIAVEDLRLFDGALTLKRVAFSGHPTFIDHSVTPPVRWDVAEATGTVSDLSWPSGPPARVRAAARLRTGGRSMLEATIAPSPLDVTARVRFEDLPAARINAYLPDTTVRLGRGTVSADIHVGHTEPGPIALSGAVTLTRVAVDTPAGASIATDPRVHLAATAAVHPDGTVVVERATLEAAPTIRGVALRGLRVETGRWQWPGTAAAPVRALARLPEDGAVELTGTVRPAGGDVRLRVAVRNAAVSPWPPLLGVPAPVDGRLDAALTIAGNYRRPEMLTTSGDATAREIRIGDGDEPAIRVPRITVSGLRLVGRDRVHVDAVAADAPAVVVIRAEDGSFPILTMLGVSGQAPENRRQPTVADRAQGDEARGPTIDVDRIAVENGYARFVDRTTTPPFTEELRRIAAVVTDLDSTDAEPARVEVDAVVGDGGALDLAGRVAPFAEPFVLDVAGTVSDFRVPVTNPYLRETFGWVARRGRLTTRVHYRVEGDRLDATNEVLVENLTVRRATGDVDPRIGLPLGLVVALLKNARGDIEVSLPVSGSLGQPEFGFGDALARAARQLVGKLVTGPFEAIGRALRGEDPGDIADLAIDPVRFPEGSARLPSEAREHLRHVGEFLRDTPRVDVTLRPVVGRDDLHALRREAAIAAVQRYQRRHPETDFEVAARALAQAEPDAPIDTVLESLAAREPLPVDAAQRLAASRTAATREALAASAAGAMTRVRTGAAAIHQNDPEGGRIELELASARAAEPG